MKTLSATEAASRLGITPATLYAYVSRGLIRSEIGPDGRSRRYREEDVRALQQRREARRDPQRLLESALDWGSPILESSLSLIADGHLYYRGLDAAELAGSASVEQVAGLLWTGRLDGFPGWPEPVELALPGGSTRGAIPQALAQLAPLERFAVLVPWAAAKDLAALDLRPQGVLAAAPRIVALLAWALGGTWPGQAKARSAPQGLAATLARALAPGVEGAEAILRAILILSADHELNVSTFAARCAASAGATPYAAVSAGLAAIGGTRHGGHQERVEALFDAVGSPDCAERVLAARLRGGEPIAGFGHSLYYSEGDPRARVLLAIVQDSRSEHPAMRLAAAIAAAADKLLGERPNVDFALVAAARALELPPGSSSLGLFALGRSLGWLAHAMEQYADGRLIRPRARYTGPAPRSADV